ncbi:Nucleotide-binding universal stress protein, UspA family [Pseudorhodobacter antarcticus]|jgi:nucleotide-binding universal stress UspA family protein|uniref:Nucleotide-binding universal stress protein, UspA family n=1 Tax=Pseudorhodobacter antarcticus TaxID=1077947 RepID=A0A1H8LAK2_9RHOB|nr:universal stress protein [Pseudorhodobacter antarcticus]SEO02143.1 Nucleotide-binding universal stress protein, UspA family [Pseudorhodobacter antarcticus]
MKIIALVDGSAYAHSVCALAGWASARLDAAVEALHVVGRREAVAQDLSGAIRLGARTALMAELAALDTARAKLVGQQGRAILDDAARVLAGAGAADVTTRLRTGDLLEEMGTDFDLIVVGKRGAAADFAKGHLGSNVERIVRGAKVPVLVATRAFKPIARVLVAFDGGPSAVRSISHIAQSQLYHGLEVVLVSVGDVPAAGVEAALARLHEAGLTASAEHRPGVADAVLVQMAAEFDVLVMGAYGHSRIRNLIIGSTTTEVIRSCKIPVMLVR